MRLVSAVSGILLMIIGLVASITGDFSGFSSWLIAAGLGVIGGAGLYSLRTVSEDTTETA